MLRVSKNALLIWENQKHNHQPPQMWSQRPQSILENTHWTQNCNSVLSLCYPHGEFIQQLTVYLA